MAVPREHVAVPAIRRLQIVTISVVGALAVLAFLLSLLLTGGIGELLGSMAFGLGIVRAVIGVLLPVVGV